MSFARGIGVNHLGLSRSGIWIFPPPESKVENQEMARQEDQEEIF
jgi:hypothetical protein